MIDLFIIVLLTLVNAFFSISEIALVSVKKNRIDMLVDKGNQSAKFVQNLTSNPEKFLSSVQVGITLIGLITGAYGGATLGQSFGIILQDFGLAPIYAQAVAMVTVFFAITYFTIVVGELVPKTIAMNNPEKIALTCAPIIHYFSIIVYPFVKLLSGTTSLVVRILGIKTGKEDILSEEELRIMLKTAGHQGILEKEEGVVHDNLFVFNDLKAKSLMTYYTDLDWIDSSKPFKEIIKIVSESTHSKLPVAEGSIDNIQGYIALSDFWKYSKDEGFSINSILRPSLYLTENSDAFDIISIFKKEKTHLGFVLDEYGSVRGMITLHDLMTALFGELPDENEEEEQMIIKRNDNSYLIDGSMPIYEFNQYFHEELIQTNMDYTTIAGFLLYLLEGFPREGEKVMHEQMLFEVVDMDKVKIDKVLLTFIAKEEL